MAGCGDQGFGKGTKSHASYRNRAKNSDLGLRKEVGATPAATVAARIYVSLKKDPQNTPFLKVSQGEFMLKPSSQANFSRVTVDQTVEDDEPGESVGIIQAFGMFWRKEMVLWKRDPELLGEQQQGALAVNFCDQRGIYLLHDGRDIIYVGRTTDQALGTRLFQHTFDRLNTRWNRFSWFGIAPVTSDGKLESPNLKILDSNLIIATMEALLIEALEPPQNRKRGDDFRAVEYIQSENPTIRKKQMAAMFSEWKEKMDKE